MGWYPESFPMRAGCYIVDIFHHLEESFILCSSVGSSSLLLACSISSAVAALHTSLTFVPNQYSKTVKLTGIMLSSVLSLNSVTTSVSLNNGTSGGGGLRIFNNHILYYVHSSQGQIKFILDLYVQDW